MTSSGHFIPYSYRGESISRGDLFDMLNSEDASKFYLKKAKPNRIPGHILAFGGGYCVGFALSSALFSDQVNLPLLGVGAALIALAIPFEVGYAQNLALAIKAYNKILVERAAVDK